MELRLIRSTPPTANHQYANYSDMKEKVCTGCHRSLPITEFHLHRSSKDGLKHQCKGCKRSYNYVYRLRNNTAYKRIQGEHREESAQKAASLMGYGKSGYASVNKKRREKI